MRKVLKRKTVSKIRPNNTPKLFASKNLAILALILLISLVLFMFQQHVLTLDELSQVVSIVKGPVLPQQAAESNQIAPTILFRPHLSSKFPARLPRQGSRLRVAFAITMTMDGNFLDGAAIFAYSVAEASRGKDYDWSLVAFVHPNVTESRLGLTKLGFHVIEAPIPINVSAIEFEFLREKINKNGCCGAAELIKLNSYRLLQYDRVVHMDADTYVLNSFEHLFEKNFSLIYTTDPNMASFKADDKMPVQGGFLLLQPNLDDYKNIINILMTTEFRKGKGWNRTEIGWFWGGMTVQGVLPYYYNRITAPRRSARVDRCLYNTMADVPECTTQTLKEIKTVHFTVCQKPWACYRAWINELCGDLHRRWLELRKRAEAFYGLPVLPKACLKGHGTYQMMRLDLASMPVAEGYIRDDSPDWLEPIGNHKYLTPQYD